MAINRLSKYQFAISQSISGSFDTGDTIEASFLAKGNSSTANQYVTQFVDMKYSVSSESISLQDFPKGTFPERFYLSQTYATKSFVAGVPEPIQYVEFTLTGSLNGTGSNTYNSGGAANYQRELELDYDDFTINVHKSKTELTEDGLLVFTSPNRFIKADKDGIEIKGGTVEAENLVAGRLEVFGDATIFGDVTATANEPYDDIPQSIGISGSAGSVSTFARGDHIHKIPFATLNSVTQEGEFTNISGSEASTGSFGQGFFDKVGIGTTSPIADLDIRDGHIKVGEENIYASNVDQPYLIVADDDHYTGATTNWGTYGMQHRIKTNSGGVPRLTIDTPGGERFSVDNNGKVGIGIGTTTPTKTLTVHGESFLSESIYTDGHLYFEDDFHLGYYGGGLNFAETSVADYRLFIEEGGNIGIGTNSPDHLLTVNGDVKFIGAGRPNIRFITETETAQIADSFSGDTDKAYIRFDDNSNSNDAGFIMHETRNVTETDEGVLHLCPSDNNSVVDYVSIHGTNQADKIKLHTDGQISGVTTLTTSDNILINGDSKSLIVRNSSETDAGIKFQDSQATTTQNFELLYNCSSEDLRFKSDTNDNILYLEHDGNVGIGTNNPERNLEVVGTTHAKGSGGSAPFLITSTTNDAMFMRKDGNSEKHTFVDDGNDDGSSGGLGWRIYHGNGGVGESLSVRPTGEVNCLKNPSFAARKSDSNVTLTANTWTNVVFNAQYYDKTSNYDTTNGRFTAPVGGRYLFIATLRFNPYDGTDYVWSRLCKNGTAVRYGSLFDADEGNTKEYAASVLHAIVDCSANDYFNIQVYAYDGAVLHSENNGNEFSGHLIG